ncbi:unnamed protein product, partial [Tenebrio molitor]
GLLSFFTKNQCRAKFDRKELIFYTNLRTTSNKTPKRRSSTTRNCRRPPVET